MEDGYYHKVKNVIILSTDCFSEVDCKKLVKAISTLGVVRTVNKHSKKNKTFRIRISRKSMPLLIDLIKPHMHFCFYYKLGKYQ